MIIILDKESAKPFKYISTKYNISQPALYKRIQKFNKIQLEHKTGITFQDKYMTKDHHKWFIDPEGIKLITFQKRNSTSPFKPKKLNKYKNKERQPTRNDLLDEKNKLLKLCKKLTKDNDDLTDSIKSLTASNNTMTRTNNSYVKTIKRLRNTISHDTKLIGDTKAHEKQQEKLTQSLQQHHNDSTDHSLFKWFKNFL